MVKFHIAYYKNPKKKRKLKGITLVKHSMESALMDFRRDKPNAHIEYIQNKGILTQSI